MKVQAIIPTAGLGTRLKSKVLKPFVLLNGKPLIVYTLKAFEKSRLVDGVILVVHEDFQDVFKKLVVKYRLKKICRIVVGGNTRGESVGNGLKVLDADTDIVVIHDGASPLISSKLIDQSVELCRKQKAVIVAVPVKPTIKRVNVKDSTIQQTLNRSELWEAQTPQVFKKDVILMAHRRNRIENPTDDAAMVEAIDIKVKVLMGSYQNIKVTTKEDVVLVNALFRSAK